MISSRIVVSCSLVIASAALAVSDSRPETKDRARVVFAHALPHLDGNHLNATVVEVNYGPDEFSPPHTHPCAVVGYVVEGALRTRVAGESETVFKAGESFYEAPNSVHAVSANASSTEPAKLLAYFVCDHDTPLSRNVPDMENTRAR
jgi:quercetin dioxygenase-like cupin family protein